jgi:hypothetical protein
MAALDPLFHMRFPAPLQSSQALAACHVAWLKNAGGNVPATLQRKSDLWQQKSRLLLPAII